MKMREVNNNISLEEIAANEKSLKLRFPDSYRRFLIASNGGVPNKQFFYYKNCLDDGSLIDVLFGLTDSRYRSLIRYYYLYRQRVPSNTIPIGSDPGGNLILLSISGSDYGKVYFWDHEMEADEGQTPDYSNLTLIADSFEEFINNLKSAEEMNQVSISVEN